MIKIHCNVTQHKGNYEQHCADHNGGVDQCKCLCTDTVVEYTCEIHINVVYVSKKAYKGNNPQCQRSIVGCKIDYKKNEEQSHTDKGDIQNVRGIVLEKNTGKAVNIAESCGNKCNYRRKREVESDTSKELQIK